MRTIFDDKSVDIVSIAAPNHWHALAAIWAMQAGKDVYVEKPVSHNVTEGRRIVQVAEKTGRICQAGTQNRSSGALAAAAEYIRDGKLGEVKLARSIVYGRREIDRAPRQVRGARQVDYDLFLGPAADVPLTRPKLHYDWHWVWNTGNGELGNNNIHSSTSAGGAWASTAGGLRPQRRRAARLRGRRRDAQHADGRPQLRPGDRSCRRSGG